MIQVSYLISLIHNPSQKHMEWYINFHLNTSYMIISTSKNIDITYPQTTTSLTYSDGQRVRHLQNR